VTPDVDRRRESIRDDVEHEDDEVRRQAIQHSLSLPSHEALPLLIRCLGDPSWRVRNAAIERLVAAPSGWLVAEVVIEALADGENAGRRNAALEALIRCGDRTVPMLLEATASPDVDVRKLVVDALAGIGNERASPRLVEMLEDSDANVRAAAADALGVVGGAGVAKVLRQRVTRDEDGPLVRLAMLHALARLEVPLPARALGSALHDPILQPAAFAVLGRVEDREAEEHLLKGLSSASRSTREAAAEGLLRFVSLLSSREAEDLTERIRDAAASSSKLVPEMLERLGDADLGLRLQRVQFLGLLRLPETVVPLLLTARDEALAPVALATLERFGSQAEQTLVAAWSSLDSEARRLACVLLGRTAGEAGKRQLLATLDGADPALRAAAARSLGRRRCTEALGNLVHRLEACASETDPESEDEQAALREALLSIAKPANGAEAAVNDSAVLLLGSLVEHAAEPVRSTVAYVLGEIGRAEDAPLLNLLLQDPSAVVRCTAVKALARLQPGAVSEPLRLALVDEAASVRRAAAAALGASQELGRLRDLERLLEDQDASVRAAAARAIGESLRRGDPERERRAFGLLQKALSDEGSVALAAAEALADTGGEGARLARSLLEHPDPELVQAAVRCLANHDTPEITGDLIPMLTHPAWFVRAEVVRTLAELGSIEPVRAILHRLEIEQDDFVRQVILQSLAKLEA
jgi:HEAT repeat protein